MNIAVNTVNNINYKVITLPTIFKTLLLNFKAARSLLTLVGILKVILL